MLSSQITVIPQKVIGRDDLVVLPKREFELMQKQIKYKIPSYRLQGKAVSRLDKIVIKAEQEHRAGKTKKIHSLADLG